MARRLNWNKANAVSRMYQQDQHVEKRTMQTKVRVKVETRILKAKQRQVGGVFAMLGNKPQLYVRNGRWEVVNNKAVFIDGKCF